MQRIEPKYIKGVGMEDEKKGKEPTNYERFVVKRYLEEYWRADEKVSLVLLGLSNQLAVTTLCKLNNVSPSQFYEWREQFIARGKEGLMGNGGRSKREVDLEKKIHVLERCIGELTLEKELLKKISSED